MLSSVYPDLHFSHYPSEHFLSFQEYREYLLECLQLYYQQTQNRQRYSPCTVMALSLINQTYAESISLSHLA